MLASVGHDGQWWGSASAGFLPCMSSRQTADGLIFSCQTGGKAEIEGHCEASIGQGVECSKSGDAARAPLACLLPTNNASAACTQGRHQMRLCLTAQVRRVNSHSASPNVIQGVSRWSCPKAVGYVTERRARGSLLNAENGHQFIP